MGAYNEESYDYGQYGEAGYDDGSGVIDPNTGMPLVGADGNKALNDLIKSKMFRSEDGTFGCCECDYSTKYNTTMQNHIESKHLSTSGFHCSYCQKFCPTRNSLK